MGLCCCTVAPGHSNTGTTLLFMATASSRRQRAIAADLVGQEARAAWLRATRMIEEFDEGRSGAVARALGPVLIAAGVL